MSTIDELVIKIGADIAGLTAGLDKAKAEISTFSSGISSQSQQMASGIRGMVGSVVETSAKILAGIGIIGIGVGGVMAKGAADVEGYSAILGQLYGNVDTAGQKLKWIFDFAKTTPFEVPELISAFVKLKAYGIEGETVLRTLGDTASAMGKPVNMAVEALADAQTGQFERLKEFGIKAVEVNKENAVQMGLDADAVGKTVLISTDKNGKQRVDIIDRNNREIITSTLTSIWNEKYAGGMEKQSKTLGGMVSNIKDAMNQAGLAIMGFDVTTGQFKPGSLYMKIKSVAENIMNTLGEIDFTEIAKKVEDVVNQIIEVVKKIWDEIQPTIDNLKSIFSDLGTTFSEVFGSMGGKGDVIKSITGLLNDLTGAIAKVVKFFKDNPELAKLIMVIGGAFIAWAYIIPIITGIVGAISGIAAAIAVAGGVIPAILMLIGGPIGLLILLIAGLFLAWKMNLFGIQDKVHAAVSWISEKFDALKGIVAGAASWLKEKLDLIPTPLLALLGPIGLVLAAFKHFEKIKEILGGAWDAISAGDVGGALDYVKSSVLSGYESMKTGVSEKFSDIVGGVKGFVKDHEREFKVIGGAILTVATGGMWPLWKNNVGGIRDATTEAWETIKTKTSELAEWLAARWEEIKTASSQAWDALKNAVSEKWDAIKTTVSDAVTAIVNLFTPYYEQLKSIGSTLFTKLKEGLELAYNTFVKPYIDTVQNNITMALDFGARAYNWGKNLLSNFIDGIKSMFGSLSSTLVDWANSVADYIAIGSPAKVGPLSKLMEWGPNLVKTFAQGITGTMPVLNSAIARLNANENKINVKLSVDTENLETLLKESIESSVFLNGLQVSGITEYPTQNTPIQQIITQNHNWNIKIEKIENKADADYLLNEIQRRIIKKTAVGVL